MSNEELIIKIKSNITIDTNNCWLWNGVSSKSKDGYGHIFIGNRSIRVHILSAILFLNYDINSNKQINHKCNIRKCCNPEHLYVGTQSQNLSDRWKESRKNIRTHCKNGHIWNEENTYLTEGRRKCKLCRKNINKKYWQHHA